MRELFASFAPSAVRFAHAKAAVDAEYRSYRAHPREVPRRVLRWLELGFDRDPTPRYWETVRAATRESLAAFSTKVTQRPHRIIVIGDPERVDLEALAEIAPVQQLDPAALFSWDPPANAE